MAESFEKFSKIFDNCKRTPLLKDFMTRDYILFLGLLRQLLNLSLFLIFVTCLDSCKIRNMATDLFGGFTGTAPCTIYYQQGTYKCGRCQKTHGKLERWMDKATGRVW